MDPGIFRRKMVDPVESGISYVDGVLLLLFSPGPA